MQEIDTEPSWDLTLNQIEDHARWATGPEGDARREAELPETTGARLETIARQMYQTGSQYPTLTTPFNQYQHFIERREAAYWVLEAVFAHPNVPPTIVRDIFGTAFFSNAMVRAFFSNPTAPFTLLELPDFLMGLSVHVQNRLLKQETMPPVMVRSLAAQPLDAKGHKASTIDTAHLHIAVAGEADPENWENELRVYWQRFCDRATGRARRWHVDLAEQGLAPAWAARPLPPPEKLARHKVLEKWFASAHTPNSEETLALARRIAPYLELEFVAHHLRAEATEADLMNLLAVTQHEYGLVGRAILRHPSVSGNLIRRLVRADEGRFRHDAACLPQTPPDIIAEFLQSPVPEIRRAARAHPNAPGNAREQSLNATRKCMKAEQNIAGSEFISLLWVLENQDQNEPEVYWADSESWTSRLEQILRVTTDNLDTQFRSDILHRTPCALFRTLSHDGNRFVRAAARAKLADPNYQFVL